MLDIALIREKPDWIKEQLHNLNDEAAIARIDAILDLDQRRRALLNEVEAIKADRNKLNKQMGRFRGNKKLSPAERIGGARQAIEALQAGEIEAALDALTNPQAVEGMADESDDAVRAALDELTAQMKAVSARVGELDEEVRLVEAELTDNMLWIPNLPHASTPVGLSEEENVIWEPQGQPRAFDFDPLPHWELGPALDIIDFERGVKLSGTRFYVLKHTGARLYRAMINWLIDVHTGSGFIEMYTPFMVREDMMIGSAQFPKFRDVVYFDEESQLYMLPTAEVALTNLHRDEIFEADDLPLYYVAHTPCFRREKMSAGRDVRGIKRVHQFEKVEMYKFTTPETSYDELETLTQAAERVCGLLGIPCRRVEMVTGDLGFAASKKYDVEMWAPGCQEWLEVSSCSNTEDFQARRANIRYRPEPGARPRYVHTLNGSGLGMARTLIAVLENYQQADGSVIVPDVLRSYMGGLEVIEPNASA